MVDISASALFDRPLGFRCCDWRRKKDEDAYRERAIYSLWKDNEGATMLMESAISAGIEGDVFFELYRPEGETKLVIVPHSGVDVFPMYRFRGGYQSRYLNECHIFYEIEHPEYSDVFYHQVYYMSGGVCWTFNETYWIKNREVDQLSKSDEYQTLLPFIPVYQVSNKKNLNSYFGHSDYHSAREIFVELNKAISDLSEARAFGAFPVTVLKGYGIDIDSLKLEPGAIWEIPGEDGSADTLSVSAEFYKAMFENIDKLQDLLCLIMEIPGVSIGRTENLRDTSGVALEILFSLLIKKTNRKRAYWNRLTTMNGDALRMMEIYGIDDFGGSTENELVWGDIIPRALDSSADVATKLVAADIWTHSRAMDYTGVEDADEELCLVKEEKNGLLDPYGQQAPPSVPSPPPFE
jgi:hypothetical protein